MKPTLAAGAFALACALCGIAAPALAQSASEQAAGVEEISSTIEEMIATVSQNTENADTADMLAKSSYELAEKLQNAGITAAPSLSTKQCTHDKQMEERGFFIEADHPVIGRALLAGLPFHFSDTPKGNYTVAPLLGQHNDYVFGELLGLSKDEIKRLTEEKVLY